ncbi:hypothetical protein N0V95_000499 [Ascochyta clinopodiicola]|nr:hypothetical protein N0V95_000499 [Ascochyta clinopodiicola]
MNPSGAFLLDASTIDAVIQVFYTSPSRALVWFDRLRLFAHYPPDRTASVAGRVGKSSGRGGWHAGPDDKEHPDALVTRFWVGAVWHGVYAYRGQSIEEFISDEFKVLAATRSEALLAPRIREVARIAKAWGADFHAALARRRVLLQADPSKSLIEQLAVAADHHPNIDDFAAAFSRFYGAYQTRGRPLTLDVVTAANVRAFLTQSRYGVLPSTLPEERETGRQTRRQTAPSETASASARGRKRRRSRPSRGTEAPVAPPRPPTVGEHGARDEMRNAEASRPIIASVIDVQPPDEQELQQVEEEQVDDQRNRLSREHNARETHNAETLGLSAATAIDVDMLEEHGLELVEEEQVDGRMNHPSREHDARETRNVKTSMSTIDVDMSDEHGPEQAEEGQVDDPVDGPSSFAHPQPGTTDEQTPAPAPASAAPIINASPANDDSEDQTTPHQRAAALLIKLDDCQAACRAAEATVEYAQECLAAAQAVYDENRDKLCSTLELPSSSSPLDVDALHAEIAVLDDRIRIKTERLAGIAEVMAGRPSGNTSVYARAIEEEVGRLERGRAEAVERRAFLRGVVEKVEVLRGGQGDGNGGEEDLVE